MDLGVKRERIGTLFVIEAAGKKESLLTTLQTLGVQGDVFSTFGHLLANPKSLWPVFLDIHFKELRREPINPDLVTELRIAAANADRVIVATDPDEEGHVIATDVATLLADHKNVLRGLFYGFDLEGVRRGMARLEHINHQAAVPGNVRRVIDRWIGSTFSDLEKGVSVGRVLTGALALMKRKPVALGYLPVDMPSRDGGAPFRGNIPITRDNQHLLQKYMLDLGKQAPLEIESKTVCLAGLPQDHIDTILSVSEKTGESIRAVQERLQRFYERQHISYPRTDARAYNRSSITFAKTLAERNHIEVKADLYPVNQQEHAHESIHLLKAIELDREIQYGEDQEILTHIGRQMIRAGQPKVVTTADGTTLPFWAKAVAWERSTTVNNNWRDDQLPPPFKPVMYTAEQAALRFLHESGLGRPGTMVSHATRLVGKDLLTPDFRLTEKGNRFLRHAPSPLFDQDVHQILDKAGVITMEEGVVHGEPISEELERRIVWALKESGLLASGQARQQRKRTATSALNVTTSKEEAKPAAKVATSSRLNLGGRGEAKKDLN